MVLNFISFAMSAMSVRHWPYFCNFVELSECLSFSVEGDQRQARRAPELILKVWTLSKKNKYDKHILIDVLRMSYNIFYVYYICYMLMYVPSQFCLFVLILTYMFLNGLKPSTRICFWSWRQEILKSQDICWTIFSHHLSRELRNIMKYLYLSTFSMVFHLAKMLSNHFIGKWVVFFGRNQNVARMTGTLCSEAIPVIKVQGRSDAWRRWLVWNGAILTGFTSWFWAELSGPRDFFGDCLNSN